METYSGNNDSVGKEVGRPIIVYEDSSKQNNKDETSPASGMFDILMNVVMGENYIRIFRSIYEPGLYYYHSF